MDVKTTFLYGELKEEVYMIQREDFDVEKEHDKVCLRKRSLRTLKQAPRQWNFNAFIIAQQFIVGKYDACVYYKQCSNGDYIYLLLYVDDMLISCKNKDEVSRLKSGVSYEFEKKDLGPLRKFWEWKLKERKNRKLHLTQSGHLKKVIEKFKITSAELVFIPLTTQFKLSSEGVIDITDEDQKFMENIPYFNIMGSLIYAMIWQNQRRNIGLLSNGFSDL